MKTKKVIGAALLMALVTNLAYWVGYRQGSNASSATLKVPGKLRQVGLAYREERNTVSQIPPGPTSAPALITANATRQVFQVPFSVRAGLLSTSAPPSPRKGIEEAERHNLYEMQKYQRRVLGEQLQPVSLPITVTPPIVDFLEKGR